MNLEEEAFEYDAMLLANIFNHYKYLNVLSLIVNDRGDKACSQNREVLKQLLDAKIVEKKNKYRLTDKGAKVVDYLIKRGSFEITTNLKIKPSTYFVPQDEKGRY